MKESELCGLRENIMPKKVKTQKRENRKNSSMIDTIDIIQSMRIYFESETNVLIGALVFIHGNFISILMISCCARENPTADAQSN